MHIWQCAQVLYRILVSTSDTALVVVQGHPVCEPCKARPEVRHCPTCRQRIVGRATIVEKIAAQVFGSSPAAKLGPGPQQQQQQQDPLHVSGEESEDTGALDTSPDTSPVSSPEPSFRPRLPTYFLSLRNGTRVGNEDFSLNSLREAATGPARALRLEDDFGLVSSPQRVVHDSDSDIREFDFGRDSHPASFGFLD